MKCLTCGKEFSPRRKTQQCCSHACYYTYQYQKSHPLIRKNCAICGKPFQTRNPKSACCSEMCRQKKYKPSEHGSRDREFTELTPYLCQKWYQEGMPIRQIAELLDRSKENVIKALAIPLSRAKLKDMEEYAR